MLNVFSGVYFKPTYKIQGNNMDLNGNSHENGVQNFYSAGLHSYHDYHRGYLNFGYWENNEISYEEAADSLVKKLGTLLGLNEDSELLDVGCGMGPQDIYLFNLFQPK